MNPRKYEKKERKFCLQKMTSPHEKELKKARVECVVGHDYIPQHGFLKSRK